MQIDMGALLRDQPVVLLFLIIGLGYLVGKIHVKGFELGPAGGVLFAALAFGHFGFEIPAFIETIGFVFFIYSVGFQAGPRFVSSFRRDGAKYFLLALVIAGTGTGLAILMCNLFDLGSGYAAGILGGAMTSTPTLAAAQDVVSSGTLSFGADLTAEQVTANITVGYAITYVFGLIGLILVIRLLPRILRIDLPSEAEKLKVEMNLEEDDGDESDFSTGGVPAVRTYSITDDTATNKPLAELDILADTNCLILEIRRGAEHLTPSPKTILEHGDIIAVVGSLEEQMKLFALFGAPLVDSKLLSRFQIVTKRMIVTDKKAVGKTLRDLAIVGKHGCFVSRFEREGMVLEISPDIKLDKGDILSITGIKNSTLAVIEEMGTPERPIHETDLMTFAFGIVLGVIVGTITVKVGNLPIGIGMSGGLLVSGLFVGYLRSHHPTFGRVPAAARFILMKMGILFFLAGVGLRAGHGLIDGLKTAGPQIFVSGMVTTIVPVLIGFAVGRLVLKMNPALLLGAITGSMTSTPSLSIVNDASKSTIPALGYAGAYAIATILLTIVGQLIIRIT